MLATALLVVFAVTSSVDDAKAAYAALDYQACEAAATSSLEQPGGRAQRVDAYRLLGLCTAALGDADRARDAFTRMLAIDRDAALPDGLSPRFTSAYREAKGALLDVPPTSLTVESDLKDGRVRVVRVAVVDPQDVVAKIAFRGEGGVLSAPVKKASRLELELPGEGPVELVGLDRGGGEVLVVVLPPLDAPPAAAPAPTADVAAADADADAAPGFPWLAVGAGAAAVVVVGAAVAGGVVWALQPPSRVGFRSDVVFGDD